MDTVERSAGIPSPLATLVEPSHRLSESGRWPSSPPLLLDRRCAHEPKTAPPLQIGADPSPAMQLVGHRYIQGKLSGDISPKGTLSCAAVRTPSPRCAARMRSPSLHPCHCRQVAQGARKCCTLDLWTRNGECAQVAIRSSRARVDQVVDEEHPPSSTGRPDTMLTGGCGGADAQVPPEAQKPRAPLAPTHALRGGRLAQLDCARRGQVCPAGGQTGYRGAPDPLYAYAENFHVGILQEQVCTLPPLANPGMPLTDRTPCCADFAERAPVSPRAYPDVSGRLWHVLGEKRTHGFCVFVLCT